MYENYMGVIEALGFAFTPAQWAYCAGQIVSINQQTALFSLLGCRFGGDCRDVFGYPDLRGRVPIGQFQGPGLPDWSVGMKPGFERTVLTTLRMPSHSHAHNYTGTGSLTDISVAKTHGTVQEPDHGDYIAEPSNGFGSAPNGNLYVTEAQATAAGTAQIGGVSDIGGGFVSQYLQIHNTGVNDSFEIMQPSLVMNYCICIDGLYPSRS
ncbi:MAG: tail fiber protein [Alphaproteobacteria bacterium]|nr:tail fiber protein [Alphaproteobacteria bacterium]